MYITVRRYEPDPSAFSQMDEIARRVQEEFLPIVSRARGFVDYYLLTGEETGHTILTTVSIFQDKNGADESVRLAADWVRQNLSEFLPNPPEVTTGEVRVHSKSRVY